jgi:hypothetical protein
MKRKVCSSLIVIVLKKISINMNYFDEYYALESFTPNNQSIASDIFLYSSPVISLSIPLSIPY